MTHRGKPIVYVRVATGGRKAARAQELRLREILEAAGVPHHGAHVYCDIDTSPRMLGHALGLLLAEAEVGRVGTVIVPSLASFGCYDLVVHALTALASGGAHILVATDIIDKDVLEAKFDKGPYAETVACSNPS